MSFGVARAIVQAKKFEDTIAALIREWALANPNIVVAHHRLMTYARKEGLYRKSWTAGKSKMEAGARYADIPGSLYKLMMVKVKRDFWDHQDLVEAFFRHYQLGLIAPRSDRPKFGPHH